MSYVGQLNLTSVGDRDSCPAPGCSPDSVQIAFDELAQRTLIPAPWARHGTSFIGTCPAARGALCRWDGRPVA